MRWARFAVEKARYDETGRLIERVSVRSVSNGIVGPTSVWPRSTLLSVLEKGWDVLTVPTGSNLLEMNRRNIRNVSLNKRKYIRIDEEETTRDFLGDLPAM